MGIQMMSKEEVQRMHDKEILRNFVYFLDDYKYWIERGGGDIFEYLSDEEGKRFLELRQEAYEVRRQRGVKQ